MRIWVVQVLDAPLLFVAIQRLRVLLRQSRTILPLTVHKHTNSSNPGSDTSRSRSLRGSDAPAGPSLVSTCWMVVGSSAILVCGVVKTATGQRIAVDLPISILYAPLSLTALSSVKDSLVLFAAVAKVDQSLKPKQQIIRLRVLAVAWMFFFTCFWPTLCAVLPDYHLPLLIFGQSLVCMLFCLFIV